MDHSNKLESSVKISSIPQSEAPKFFTVECGDICFLLQDDNFRLESAFTLQLIPVKSPAVSPG